MTLVEINQLFTGAERLAIIGGKVSGNLECLDFDFISVYQPFLELLEARRPGLAAKLLKRQTPSGGFHLIYRCTNPVSGNMKLACTEDNQVMIETRGEGGYFLSAPSPGYKIIEGSMLDCPVLSPEDVEVIHGTAKAFDQRQRQTPLEQKQHSKKSVGDSDRPGDRFKEEHSTPEMLAKYGWREDRKTTGGMGWTRPGKEHGTSGVLLETGNLYCWSANAFPLEPEKSYDAFALYVAYEHGGNFSAAARSLAGDQGPTDRQRKEYSPSALLSQPIQAADPEEWEADIQEWPVMDKKAYRGLAGDFVALASENSEADPAAILITFLARFAVEVGSGPTLFIGDGKHHARFAAVIVGASSKARKGTSSKPVNRLYSKIEHQARYSPGPFSSGEGIIHAVRDPVKKWDEKNQCDIIADPGVKDKRFFILDEEFGGAMSQTKREGNTLSTVIRCAWDSGNLDPLTKTSKTTATGAHIGWISHITISELHAKLSETEALNGFGNRILWVCARRSKTVPLPEPMDDYKLDVIRQRLVDVINLFRDVDFTKIELGQEARKAWSEKYYADLTKDNPGLVGCIINRAEAQVIRLSMLYCLLDGMTTIGLDHLEAALALWRYCEQSARFIFDGRQTDGNAEKILAALTERSMTSTEIHRLLANHVSSGQLSRILSHLKGSNKIQEEKFKEEGKRKASTLWKIKPLCELRIIANYSQHTTNNSQNSQNSQDVLEKEAVSCGDIEKVPNLELLPGNYENAEVF